MKNEATELVFECDDNRVSLAALQKVCAELGTTAGMAAAQLAGMEVKVSFDIVASPTRGSVIFAIEPIFHFNLDLAAMLARVPGELKDHLVELGSLAAIGSFVWQTVFGGSGLFQLFKFKKDVVHSDQPTVSRVEAYLEKKLFDEGDRQFRFQLQTVVNVAASAGVRAVKVRVSGDETVVLWDLSSRTDPGLLFSTHPFNRPPPAFVRRVSSSVVRANYRGKPVQIFVAEGFVQDNTGINRVVVIWASLHPIPDPSDSTATFVRSQIVLDPIGIEISDDIPQDFENADAVVLVREAANMG